MTSEVLAALPKSILKRSSTPRSKPDPTLQSSEPTPREIRNRELALEQAYLIQQRNDIESSILAAIEALLDFPPSPDSDPACPSTTDITYVRELLKPFQPADYDSLIEERGINDRCGYVFCPRPHRVEDTGARYRILRSQYRGKNDMKVVEKKDLERWCSEECAWNRTPDAGVEIYGEGENGRGPDITRRDDVAAVTDGLHKLAIERGMTEGAVGVTVVEKAVPEPGQVPSLQHLSIHDDDYHESSRLYGSIQSESSRARRRHLEDGHI